MKELSELRDKYTSIRAEFKASEKSLKEDSEKAIEAKAKLASLGISSVEEAKVKAAELETSLKTTVDNLDKSLTEADNLVSAL